MTKNNKELLESLVYAYEERRRLRDNIRKYLRDTRYSVSYEEQIGPERRALRMRVALLTHEMSEIEHEIANIDIEYIPEHLRAFYRHNYL